jgi:putative endonuclease
MEKYFVYVIRSREGRHYIGSTQDVEKRLKQHNARANRGWTNRFSDWEVVYQETCETRLEARRRERQLKKMRGTKKYKELLGLVCVEKAPTRSAQSKNRKA